MTAPVTEVIERRPFLKLSAGALAAAAGCTRRGQRADTRASRVVLALNSVADIRPDNTDADFLVFSPLTERDIHGKLVPRLAQSWEVSPDGREWTFHLRRDARWHDGVSVTAHDIKFTLDLLSRPDVVPYRFDAVSVVDDYTITVKVQRFQSDYENNINADIVFYPKHLLEHLDPSQFWKWDFWTHPVGSGPYRFVRYATDTMIEYKANPHYFLGEPQIKHVQLKFVGGAALNELLSGQVDVVCFGQPAQIPRVLSDPRFAVYYKVYPQALAIYWNRGRPLFHDGRITRGLTLAIDRDECRRMLNLPADLPGSDGVFMPRVFFSGTLPAPLPYDPSEAERLFAAAGWLDRNSHGIRERAGVPFRFTAASDAGSSELAVLVQAHLRRVGVQMDIETLDGRVFNERLNAGRFDAAFRPLTPWPNKQQRMCVQTRYANAAALRLVDAAAAATSPDELDRIYGDLTEIYRNDPPVTRLVTATGCVFAKRSIVGWTNLHLPQAERYLQDLWLDDGKY